MIAIASEGVLPEADAHHGPTAKRGRLTPWPTGRPRHEPQTDMSDRGSSPRAWLVLAEFTPAEGTTPRPKTATRDTGSTRTPFPVTAWEGDGHQPDSLPGWIVPAWPSRAPSGLS